jgi:hypothetical protein
MCQTRREASCIKHEVEDGDRLTTTLQGQAISDGDSSAIDLQDRRTPPIKLWAAVGLGFFALTAYIFAAWVISGDATPTPRGPTPVSDAYMTLIHGWEVLNVIVLALILWLVLIRPWKRTGRITLDGMFCVVFALLIWQDPLSNYFQTSVTYSALQTNFGSWVMHIPGWYAPKGNLYGWPIVWGPCAYVYFLLASIHAGGFIMRKAKQRWPQATRLQLVLLCYFTLAIADLVGEIVWVRLGLYTFIGPPYRSLTLFYGHWYQFPLYETFFFALPLTAWACLRHFRNDKGQTFVERGVESLRVSDRQKSALRFFALLGVCNVIFLGLYNVPMQWFGVRTTAPVEDILDRSYIMNGVCGQGTSFACPGADIPIPRPGSQVVDPSGRLVEPDAPAPCPDGTQAEDEGSCDQ